MYAETSQQGRQMVFAAFNAGKIRWFSPGVDVPISGETVGDFQCGDFHTILIGDKRATGEVGFGEAVDQLAQAAGAASICIVAYSARRNVTWRTSRGYISPRCQTHLCNALPKNWDMPNYAQGNGRATGDSKELLESSTREPGAAVGTGRTHITFLGHRWDHESDLSTEAWVDEVAMRMAGGLDLQQATDGHANPFPPICNFRLGTLSRPPAKTVRKTFDRRYMFEHADAHDPAGRGYDLVISPQDPREEEAAAYYIRTRPNISRYLRGTVALTCTNPSDQVLVDPSALMGMADAVSRQVLEDNGRTVGMYALQPQETAEDLALSLPSVLEGEGQPPVVITQYATHSMEELGLADLTVDQGLAEINRAGGDVITEKVKARCGCSGVRHCHMHRISLLTRDLRAPDYSAGGDETFFNVAWRVYEEDGQLVVATISLCDVLPGAPAQTGWVRDRLLQPAYRGRRLVWHTFDKLPGSEVKTTQTFQLVRPTIRVVTRGPIASPISSPPAARQKRKRDKASLLDLIAAGVVEPAIACLTTGYKGETYTADLCQDGTIMWQDTSLPSLHAFRSAITKNNTDGWQYVFYNGTRLKDLRGRM